MTLLADLRRRGLTLAGGAQLRVVGKASVVAECRYTLRAECDELLGELRDEAENEITGWPLAYRRWVVQTVAYCLRLGYAPSDAFWAAQSEIRAQYAAHLADHEPSVEAMTAAWLAIDPAAQRTEDDEAPWTPLPVEAREQHDGGVPA